MKTLHQTKLLDLKITDLTHQNQLELEALKAQLEVIKSNLNPKIIIKDGIREVYSGMTESPNIVSILLSITGGYLTKKLVLGDSTNPIKGWLGNILQFAITRFISNKMKP